MDNSRIHAAVGIIARPNTDDILIAKRPMGDPLGGYWEFPGGKIKPAESSHDALIRELHEEVGISVKNVSLFRQLRINSNLHLDFWYVDEFSGRPYGRQGQEILWLSRRKLQGYRFLPTNQQIIKALQLPYYYLITPDPCIYQQKFLYQLEKVLVAGAKLIQFRTRANISEYKSLFASSQVLCRAHGASLLLNTVVQDAIRLFADGVHLSSKELLRLSARPVPRHLWVSASCHNVQELTHAEQIGVDFVVLSPVLSASHPKQNLLGWAGFCELLSSVSIPVFALGGLSPQDLLVAKVCGGHGIAMKSRIWESVDPRAQIKACEAMSTAYHH